MTDEHVFKMTLSLNVLEHLGINLYSSLPAVLSEVVANAYDADATEVRIDIDVDAEKIVIKDNGIGMTPTEINNRFLRVGYRRRDDVGPGAGRLSPVHARPVMGRKGLGKLSLFSIADVVEVHSVAKRPLDKDEKVPAVATRCGFIMELPEIRKAIQREQAGASSAEQDADVDVVADAAGPVTADGDVTVAGSAAPANHLGAVEADVALSPRADEDHESRVYEPDPVPEGDIVITEGTQIVLTGLRKHPSTTAAFLRRRLARRFSALGDAFVLVIDGKRVGPADRDLTKLVNYIWVYGPPSFTAKLTAGLRSGVNFEVRTVPDIHGGSVRGWIGAAGTSTALKAQDGDDSLNRVGIMVRGKLAQEDILSTTDEGGLFTKYLVGELHADFLDDDDLDDIATSSRQSIREDDPRYEALKLFLKQEVRYIEGAWNKLREADGEKAARSIASVDEWFKTLKGDDLRAARSFFGKVNLIAAEGEAKLRLISSGVIAFEGLRRRRRLSTLSNLSEENLPALIDAFQSMDDIEAAVFYEIVKDRLAIIDKFQGLVEEDQLERVLQTYLFDHLWLLDPSWERTTTPIMEKAVKSIIDDAAELEQGVLASRVDIQYRRVEGTHVIVELKKASVRTDTFKLLGQINKYRQGVISYLRQTEGENVDLRIVCVVGKDLSDWSGPDGKTASKDAMSEYGAKVLRYDNLIRDAKAQYQEYLASNEDLGPVRAVLAQIEDELTKPPPASIDG